MATHGDNSCGCWVGGHRLELRTHEGSTLFLQLYPDNFFRTNIGNCIAIRNTSRATAGVLTQEQKHELTGVSFMIESIARYGHPELFAMKVPAEEVEFWLDHVMNEIGLKTNEPRWRHTGVLEKHDAYVINACVEMFKHAKVAKLAFGKGFFKVLHDFINALTVPLPSPDVAETVCLLTNHAFGTVLMKWNWSPEDTFKKLESSGWLAEYIRCSTVPQPNDAVAFPTGTLSFYEELTKYSLFIKRKFMVGAPCGDAMHAILNGTDCGRERTQVIACLEEIADVLTW